MTYDEETCVTAGELRAMGFPVPEFIPDVGWIPRAALRGKPGKIVAGADGSLEVETRMEFTMPFRFVSMQMKLEA